MPVDIEKQIQDLEDQLSILVESYGEDPTEELKQAIAELSKEIESLRSQLEQSIEQDELTDEEREAWEDYEREQWQALPFDVQKGMSEEEEAEWTEKTKEQWLASQVDSNQPEPTPVQPSPATQPSQSTTVSETSLETTRQVALTTQEIDQRIPTDNGFVDALEEAKDLLDDIDERKRELSREIILTSDDDITRLKELRKELALLLVDREQLSKSVGKAEVAAGDVRQTSDRKQRDEKQAWDSSFLGQIQNSILGVFRGLTNMPMAAGSATSRAVGGVASQVAGPQAGGAIGQVAGAGAFAAMAPLAAAGAATAALTTFTTALRASAATVQSFVSAFSPATARRFMDRLEDVTAAVGSFLVPLMDSFGESARILNRFFTGLSSTLSPIFDQLGGVIESVTTAFASSLRPVIAALAPIIQTYLSGLQDMMPSLSRLAQGLGEMFGAIILAASPLYQTVFPVIVGALNFLADSISTVAASITATIEGITEFFQTGVFSFEGFFNRIVQLLTGQPGDNLGGNTTLAAQRASHSGIEEIARSAQLAALNTQASTVDQNLPGIATNVGNIARDLGLLWDAVRGYINAAPGAAVNAGATAVNAAMNPWSFAWNMAFGS